MWITTVFQRGLKSKINTKLWYFAENGQNMCKAEPTIDSPAPKVSTTGKFTTLNHKTIHHTQVWGQQQQGAALNMATMMIAYM